MRIKVVARDEYGNALWEVTKRGNKLITATDRPCFIVLEVEQI
jgi:hypothetical protein